MLMDLVSLKALDKSSLEQTVENVSFLTEEWGKELSLSIRKYAFNH